MQRKSFMLPIREKRAAVEQALLNRALRANKNWLDRMITRIVMTQVPQLESDVGRSKTLDPVTPQRRLNR